MRRSELSLHKIFVHVEAFMHEPIILVLPCPTCIVHNSAILLHDHCAIYDPPRPPLAYAIHYTILAMAISCKGQVRIYIHACMHACIHACKHIYTHTYVHTYIHTCMYTYMHTCMHTYIRTNIQTNMHICMHTYMHACLHTHIPECANGEPTC